MFARMWASALRYIVAASALECGGKRSATPLSWLVPSTFGANKSAVAAALCRRTPKERGSATRSSLARHAVFDPHENLLRPAKPEV
jgi:hypothetical protein